MAENNDKLTFEGKCPSCEHHFKTSRVLAVAVNMGRSIVHKVSCPECRNRFSADPDSVHLETSRGSLNPSLPRATKLSGVGESDTIITRPKWYVPHDFGGNNGG